MNDPRWSSPGGFIRDFDREDPAPLSPSSAPGRLRTTSLDLNVSSITTDEDSDESSIDRMLNVSIDTSLLSSLSGNLRMVLSSDDLNIPRSIIQAKKSRNRANGDDTNIPSSIKVKISRNRRQRGDSHQTLSTTTSTSMNDSAAPSTSKDAAAHVNGETKRQCRKKFDEDKIECNGDGNNMIQDASYDSKLTVSTTMSQQGEEHTINDLKEVLAKYTEKGENKENNRQIDVSLFPESEDDEGEGDPYYREMNDDFIDVDIVAEDDWSEHMLQPEFNESETLFTVALDHIWGCLQPPNQLRDHDNDTRRMEFVKLKQTTMLEEYGTLGRRRSDDDSSSSGDSEDEFCGCDVDSDNGNEEGNLNGSDRDNQPKMSPRENRVSNSLLDTDEHYDEDVDGMAIVPIADVPPPPHDISNDAEDQESSKYTSFPSVEEEDPLWICGCTNDNDVLMLQAGGYDTIPEIDSSSSSLRSSKGGNQTLSTCAESSIEEDSDTEVISNTMTSKRKLRHQRHSTEAIFY